MDKEGQQNEGEIQVPSFSGTTTPVSNEQLLEMQEQLLTSRREARQKQQQPAEQQAPTEPASPPPAAKKKDRAAELFQKAQERAEKEKETLPADDGDGEQFDAPGFIDASKFFEEDGKGAQGKEQTKEEETASAAETTQAPAVDLNKESNIKNLRTLAGNFKKERDDLQAKLAAAQEQLKTRPEVSALQQQLTAVQARVKELEPYELVFGLHNSPEFKQKYVVGAQKIVDSMKQIAKDYDVDEAAVEDILLSENRRELDEILEDHFTKDSPKADLKALKQQYDALINERRDYEKKPQVALAKFEEDRALKETERGQKRDQFFKQAVQAGWVEALNQNEALPENQKIYELIEIPGKKEHNEKIVRKTLGEAQKTFQFGLDYVERAIRGGHTLSPKFVSWFAALCQQAQATQVLNYSRAGLYQQYKQLQGEKGKQEQMNRPGMAAPSRGTSIGGKGERKKGKDLAAEIFMAVQKETS